MSLFLFEKCKDSFSGHLGTSSRIPAVTSLLNRRLTEAIKYHDVLHGFWAGRGTGTAALEAKLLQ